ELGVFRARNPHERPGQHVVDRLGEEEAADEGDGKGDERLDQPRAQLDQVLHQRRFGRLDFLLFVLAAHAGLPSDLATSAAEVGSLEADDGAATSVPGAIAGAALPSAAAGGIVVAAGLSAIALSICCCVLSNSRRTSATGSNEA